MLEAAEQSGAFKNAGPQLRPGAGCPIHFAFLRNGWDPHNRGYVMTLCPGPVSDLGTQQMPRTPSISHSLRNGWETTSLKTRSSGSNRPLSPAAQPLNFIRNTKRSVLRRKLRRRSRGPCAQRGQTLHLYRLLAKNLSELPRRRVCDRFQTRQFLRPLRFQSKASHRVIGNTARNNEREILRSVVTLKAKPCEVIPCET